MFANFTYIVSAFNVNSCSVISYNIQDLFSNNNKMELPVVVRMECKLSQNFINVIQMQVMYSFISQHGIAQNLCTAHEQTTKCSNSISGDNEMAYLHQMTFNIARMKPIG